MSHQFNEAMYHGFIGLAIGEYENHEFTAKAFENGKLLGVWVREVLKLECDSSVTPDNINQLYKKYKKDL